MIRINEKSIFSGLIFLFAIVILVNSAGLRSDVASVPQLIGGVLVLFSGLQLLNDLVPSLSKYFPFLNRGLNSDQAIGGEGFLKEEESTEEKRNRMLFIGWMGLFVILIFAWNMIAAIAISLILYLRWISRESWKMSILYSLIFSLAIYLVFVEGLDIYYFLGS